MLTQRHCASVSTFLVFEFPLKVFEIFFIDGILTLKVFVLNLDGGKIEDAVEAEIIGVRVVIEELVDRFDRDSFIIELE